LLLLTKTFQPSLWVCIRVKIYSGSFYQFFVPLSTAYCVVRYDIPEILLKLVLNNNQSINQSYCVVDVMGVHITHNALHLLEDCYQRFVKHVFVRYCWYQYSSVSELS